MQKGISGQNLYASVEIVVRIVKAVSISEEKSLMLYQDDRNSCTRAKFHPSEAYLVWKERGLSSSFKGNCSGKWVQSQRIEIGTVVLQGDLPASGADSKTQQCCSHGLVLQS